MFNEIEYEILDIINKYLASPFMDRIMVFFTRIGDHGIIWVIICALLLISKKTRYVGMIALVALLFSHVLVNMFLKDLFMRVRPFVNIQGMELLINEPTSYSFPSGHTASSFAASGVFGAYFKKTYAFLGFFLAVMISFSRMYLYVHFLSDVFIGAILGLLCSFFAVLLFDEYKKHQELTYDVN